MKAISSRQVQNSKRLMRKLFFDRYYRYIMIGRTAEIAILDKAYHSPKPELIAVIGRRRVGKTYLIRSFFKDRIAMLQKTISLSLYVVLQPLG